MTNQRLYLCISILVLVLSFRMYQVAIEFGYWKEFWITAVSLVIIGSAVAFLLRRPSTK